jgi:hypothetical protein
MNGHLLSIWPEWLKRARVETWFPKKIPGVSAPGMVKERSADQAAAAKRSNCGALSGIGSRKR